ncbi:MAG: orotidine 5'-phosphate decarboxylase [candidate division WS2 bacterium ADurb.Bin280]|uniref:Orotidine-5'-phosphate decarboxylase n=1 Tax=candidate division WS2 bacterium ADurb.Bin280 TaxID=1852829 RepID=A0A1V5SDM8_9BACT|nr:MAG: orotidine 5'-phosphate decarboxylase [candidate division WS2 bacterium ADurb.Bin280]
MIEMNFAERYAGAAKMAQSILCVGLDPTPELTPPEFGQGIDGYYAYMYAVGEVAAAKVAIVKPNIAHYEAEGHEGVEMLGLLTGELQNMGLMVILDAKRADIGRTMEMCGKYLFGQFYVDAATCHSYFGATFLPSQDGKSQGWLKYLEQGKCAIAMVRTSNPEGDDLQESRLEDDRPVYELLASKVATWNKWAQDLTRGVGGVGAVVGATTPEQAIKCRATAPDAFFLVPGFGTQGAGPSAAVAGMPRDGKLLLTVNSSSAITGAWRNKDGTRKGGDVLEHVAKAIDEANDQLNQALVESLGFDPYTDTPSGVPFYERLKPVDKIGGKSCTTQE